MYGRAEEEGAAASYQSGEDDRRDSKNHLSRSLLHVPHLFLHPLQGHLVEHQRRGASSPNFLAAVGVEIVGRSEGAKLRGEREAEADASPLSAGIWPRSEGVHRGILASFKVEEDGS
ncbi:hypothetical protein KM043_001075 [Ampulex compressa]|nr:hypothetical protein KM043_001075 [Ampulex compressa]